MTDESSGDWSSKVNKLSSKSKELASKGLEGTKKVGKSIAVKSKEMATKGFEGSKLAVHSISEKSLEVIEKRKEKKLVGKEPSQFEVKPLTNEIQVYDGQIEETPTHEDYSRYTANELKIRLRLLGLAVSGKKAVLVERLKTSLKGNKKEEETSVLDDLELKIQRIEEEYPEVLKPLPPDSDEKVIQNMKNSLYYMCGFTFMIYSILLLLPTALGDMPGK